MSKPPTIWTQEVLRARCDECGDCWEWRANRQTEHGRRYPQIRQTGKTINARRYIYEAFRKPIAQGMRIVPNCGNPYCVNPEHMREMTEAQKSKKYGKEGSYSGAKKAAKIAAHKRQSAKLDMQKAQEIRASDKPCHVLAKVYGVDKSMVSRVRRGEAWRDYSSPFAGLGAR